MMSGEPGFSGIVFDEIQVDVSQASGFALLDNLQTVKAQSVPEPSAILGLLAFAALGLPAAHRRR